MRPYTSLRANGSRECAPDDRLREAIHFAAQRKNGLLRRFRLRSLSYGGQVAPRNDGKLHPDSFVVPAKAGTHTPRPIILDAEAEAFCPTNAGGYGSLLSQGRRKRIQLSDSKRAFAPRGAMHPSYAFIFRPIEGVGNAGCPLHPQPRVHW